MQIFIPGKLENIEIKKGMKEIWVELALLNSKILNSKYSGFNRTRMYMKYFFVILISTKCTRASCELCGEGYKKRKES